MEISKIVNQYLVITFQNHSRIKHKLSEEGAVGSTLVAELPHLSLLSTLDYNN
jgi:hypothetical protein